MGSIINAIPERHIPLDIHVIVKIRQSVFAQLTTECPDTLQWAATSPVPHHNCPFQ